VFSKKKEKREGREAKLKAKKKSGKYIARRKEIQTPTFRFLAGLPLFRTFCHNWRA
jgi:hypothetical protein